jgi:Ca2+-transporting ATPase
MHYYHLTPEQTLIHLKTSKNGLRETEAYQRLKKYGLNQLHLEKKISPFRIFFQQFNNALVLILFIAAVVSITISSLIDAVLIITILLANAIFGFVQDYKAEKAIEALKNLSAVKAIVIRKKKKIIDATHLVPGDVIELKEGDIVPADCRIISEKLLQVDESMLTGESAPVSKTEKAILNTVSVADRINMLFAQTSVVRGKCIAVVTTTSLKTEVGKIAKQIAGIEKQTMFQKELSAFSRQLGIIIIGIIAVVAALQFSFINNAASVFITAVSLAVAAIPEGLPAVVTLTFAFGTRRMLKKNVLIRKLPVVESLGAVEVICADKTGTMTQNRMTVTQMYFNGKQGKPSRRHELLLRIGYFCSNVEKQGNKYIGDPTEVALVRAAASVVKDDMKRLDEVPFSSDRKMMSVVTKSINKGDGNRYVYTKGAPEVILSKCTRIFLNDRVIKLTPRHKKQILHVNEQMAADGLRVLGFAYKHYEKGDYESKLVFTGLQGMQDQPRPGVKHAIDICRKAGIKVIMITGDHALTAKSVADQIGLSHKTITGDQLKQMSDKELEESNVDVFARVDPSDKVRIVKALQKKYKVAMTGDGVNDAPALAMADVGVAVNSGTEVAKESADMVILDNHFATIVEGVREGRTVFDNIQKFVNYLLSSNFAEVGVVLIASIFGLLPITAVQILWINLLTDALPALALGIDPTSSGTMKRKPRKTHILDHQLLITIAVIGSSITIVLLAIFLNAIPQGIVYAQTMVFTGFVVYEMTRILVIRQRESLTLTSNTWLLAAILSSLLLQLAVLYTPLATFFNVVPLDINSWLILLAGAAIVAGVGVGFNKVLKDKSFITY